MHARYQLISSNSSTRYSNGIELLIRYVEYIDPVETVYFESAHPCF